MKNKTFPKTGFIADFDDDDDIEDDWSAEAQGFGPNDYAQTMGLYDDEDGWSNDDGNFLGHDFFD